MYSDRLLRPAVSVIALTLLLLALGASLPSTNSKRLVAKGDFEGNEGCQNCLNGVEAAWQQCIAVYGEGDADCDSNKRDGISLCQTQSCIMSAVNRHPLDTMFDAVTPTVEAASQCDTFRSNCLDVTVTLYGDCRDSGGSIDYCLSKWGSNYETCLMPTGCVPYPD